MPRQLKPIAELSRSGRKYRTDTKYAEKMRDNSRRLLEERRRERLQEIRNFDDEREGESLWKPRLYEGVEVFNSTAFCDYLGIARMTIWNWKHAGILPEPTMSDSMDRDWYSWDYIEAMRRVLKKRLRSPLDEFGGLIEEEFVKCELIDNEGNNIETNETL